MHEVIVAVDAMGGDHGFNAVIPGLALAHAQNKKAHFIIFGDEKKVMPLLAENPALERVSTLIHKPLAIEMDEKPGQALLRGRGHSSMWGAVSAIKEKKAHVAISCGNTGALMAISKVSLRMLPGILRPAIAGIWPTLTGHCVVLDLGATISNDPMHLVQFAVMGEAFARVCLNIAHPKLALLNIGKEAIKGTQSLQTAARSLARLQPPMKFIGFVEGNDIGMGVADVVVTDGFSGNIALKVAEGTVEQILRALEQEISRSFFSKLAYLLMRPTFKRCKKRFDPKLFNGGVFLGLGGLVIKSHGRSDAPGFAMGVQSAIELVEQNLQEKITQSIGVVEEVMNFDGL